MDRIKLLRGTGIGLVAFFIARSEVVGVSPLVVGYLLAVGLLGGNILCTYIGGIIGLGTVMPIIQVARYGIAMLIIAAILNSKNMIFDKARQLTVCLGAGGLMTLISISFKTFADIPVRMTILCLEGAVVFSTGIIYLYALRAIKTDYGRIAVENEAAISCLALGGTILYGIPLELPGGIILAEAVAIFSILTVLYKFGFGIGMCWSVLAGYLISYRTGIEGYFAGWIIIGVASLGICCALGGGRFLIGMIYAGMYLIVGTYLYPELLGEDGVKALVSAMMVFLLAPKRFMLRIEHYGVDDILSENSPEWGRLIIDRINNLSRAFKRIEYTLAGEGAVGIGFKDVGNIIEGFTNQLERAVPMRKTIEAAIINELALRDIHVKNLVLVKNQDERYEVYITSKVRRGKLVMAAAVRDIVSKEMGIALELKTESRNIVSRNYELICLRQKPAFKCKIATRALSRYNDQVSGDNIYVGDILDGQKLIMLADGMGNGALAAEDSNVLIDAIEELLTAGFDKETSIKIVNSYLSEKNKGEHFSTLDMLILDLHTGYGRMFKQGAATTFVKRGQWIELIKSTSLPVGVINSADCESCKKKFYHNDVIVMVSDGVLESLVFENKEDYLKNLLQDSEDLEPEEIAASIVEGIWDASASRLKDDASIIVVKLIKS